MWAERFALKRRHWKDYEIQKEIYLIGLLASHFHMAACEMTNSNHDRIFSSVYNYQNYKSYLILVKRLKRKLFFPFGFSFLFPLSFGSRFH